MPMPSRMQTEKDNLIPLSDDVCKRLADFLGFPRAYAERHRSGVGWSRRHKLRSVKSFTRGLQRGRPSAVSFHKYIDRGKHYSYQPLMDFACLDFDVKNGWNNPDADRLYDFIWDLVEQIFEFWSDKGFNPCLEHSAGKGYHIWIFADKPIHAGYWRGMFKEVLTHVGLRLHEGKWVHDAWIDTDNKHHAEIDPLMKADNTKGGIVKVPFSAHQDHPEFTALPITLDQLRTYRATTNTPVEVIQSGVDVFDTWRAIDHQLIEKQYEQHADIAIKGTYKYQKKTKKLPIFTIPDTSTRQNMIDNVYNTLPCFRRAADRSRTKEVPYDLRTPIVQILSAKGFTLEEISVWIKNNINDADDNLNPSKMIANVGYWYQFDYLAKCSSYDNTAYKSFCCPGPCGRDSPLQEEPVYRAIIDIPVEDGRTVEAILDEIRENNLHVQLYKTTRGRVTTTIVIDSLTHDELLTIIEPTTKIVETIDKAFKIHYEKTGVKKNGAILPDHREGCLKLKMDIERQELDWPEEFPALKKIPFAFKYNCTDCVYRHAYVDIEPNSVISQSDTKNKTCLYTTVVNNMDSFDVLVLTNKKLHNLVMGVKATEDNPMVDDPVPLRVLDWIAGSDTVCLDEVSLYTDAPDSAILIFRIPKESHLPTFELYTIIEDMGRQLRHFKPDALYVHIKEIVERIVLEFEDVADREGVSVYDRDVTELELVMMRAVLKRIQTFAKRSNVALTELFEAIVVAQEVEWLIVEEPDNEAVKCISVYIRPKFADVCAEFIKSTECRVIATDATMPLVDLSRVLDTPFKRINAGDPWATADMMKMIPYQARIKSVDLPREVMIEELVRFTTMADHLFGVETFVCSTPNSRAAYRVVKYDTIPDIDVMWHRSSESVGVENDKRIMLGITSPYTPKDALNWKKEILYPELLKDYSNEDIWRYDMYKTLFQTLSRVKDPKGHDRSVYIGFGQTIDELKGVSLNSVNPPDIIETTYTRDKDQRHIIPLLTAKFWMDDGVELTKGEQIAALNFWVNDEADAKKVWKNIETRLRPPLRRVTDLQKSISRLKKGL